MTTPPLLPTQPIPTPPTSTGSTPFEFEASQRSISDVSDDNHSASAAAPSAHADTDVTATADTDPDMTDPEPDDVFWAHKATQHGLPQKTEYEALKFLDQARDPDLDAWYVQRKVSMGVLPIRSRPFVRLARGGYIDHLAVVLVGSGGDDFDMFTHAAIEVLEFARPVQGLHSFKALVREFAATGDPILYKPMRHLATIDSPHVALAFDFIVRARCV